MKIVFDDGKEEEIEPHWKSDDGLVVHDEEAMMAVLLLKDIVFVGNGGLGKPAELCVNCNDTFDYSSADCEPLCLEDIVGFYEIHDKPRGVTIWCCRRRQHQPLPEIVKWMKEDGTWTEELEGFKSWRQRYDEFQATRK